MQHISGNLWIVDSCTFSRGIPHGNYYLKTQINEQGHETVL